MQKGSPVFKEHENMLAMKYRGAKDKTAGKPKNVISLQPNIQLEW